MNNNGFKEIAIVSYEGAMLGASFFDSVDEAKKEFEAEKERVTEGTTLSVWTITIDTDDLDGLSEQEVDEYYHDLANETVHSENGAELVAKHEA
jgi:hypothetical protein